jgi:hypothetical protein
MEKIININEIENNLVIEFFIIKINQYIYSFSDDKLKNIKKFIILNENILNFIKIYYYFYNKKIKPIIINKNYIFNIILNYNYLLININNSLLININKDELEKIILDLLLKLICKNKNKLVIIYNKLNNIEINLNILWNKTKIKYQSNLNNNNIENYKKIIQCIDIFILINKKYNKDLEELNKEKQFYIDKINFMQLYSFDEYF